MRLMAPGSEPHATASTLDRGPCSRSSSSSLTVPCWPSPSHHCESPSSSSSSSPSPPFCFSRLLRLVFFIRYHARPASSATAAITPKAIPAAFPAGAELLPVLEPTVAGDVLLEPLVALLKEAVLAAVEVTGIKEPVSLIAADEDDDGAETSFGAEVMFGIDPDGV